MAKAKKLKQTKAHPTGVPASAKQVRAEEPRKAHTPVNSLDSDRKDSRGEPKTKHHKDAKSGKESHAAIDKHEKPELVGPRGKNASRETLSEQQQREQDEQREVKLGQGMSSTDAIDSRGESKNVHAHEAQGYDKHGARIPDKKGAKMEDVPAQIGPRGVGAPQDSHHGKKPAPHEASNLKRW